MPALRSCAFGLALAFTCLALGAPSADAATDDGRWLPRLQFGGKTGNERHLWEMQLDVPLWQDGRSLLFADVRGRMDDASSKEGNFGLAFRRMLGEDWIAGGYGFFDVLHSTSHEEYLQGTIGAELFSENWELRGNYYLPEAGARDVSGAGASGAAIVGNTIQLTSGGLRERALPGFDVEVGRRLPFFGHEFWVHGGFFHFNAGGFENVTGPRLRAEWALGLDQWIPGGQLTLGAEWQEDGVRGSQGFAVARVEIPLGSASSTDAASWQQRRMQKRIQRDVDIVTAAGSSAATTEPGLNPLTGKPYGDVYFAEAGAEGAGTQDDPTSLEGALALAREGGVVVALDGGGSFSSHGFSLGSGMTLVGGGTALPVMGASGQTTMLPLLGGTPTLLLDHYGGISLKGQGIVIQGLKIEASHLDFHGLIQGYDVSDVRILDLDLAMNSRGFFLHHSGAIDLANASNIEIARTRIRMNDGDLFLYRTGGIRLRGNLQGEIVLRDNVISGGLYESIAIYGYARTGPLTIEATGNQSDGWFYVSGYCEGACPDPAALRLGNNVVERFLLDGTNLRLEDLGGNTPTPSLDR